MKNLILKKEVIATLNEKAMAELHGGKVAVNQTNRCIVTEDMVCLSGTCLSRTLDCDSQMKSCETEVASVCHACIPSTEVHCEGEM